jgi:hypothetical protein
VTRRGAGATGASVASNNSRGRAAPAHPIGDLTEGLAGVAVETEEVEDRLAARRGRGAGGGAFLRQLAKHGRREMLDLHPGLGRRSGAEKPQRPGIVGDAKWCELVPVHLTREGLAIRSADRHPADAAEPDAKSDRRGRSAGRGVQRRIDGQQRPAPTTKRAMYLLLGRSRRGHVQDHATRSCPLDQRENCIEASGSIGDSASRARPRLDGCRMDDARQRGQEEGNQKSGAQHERRATGMGRRLSATPPCLGLASVCRHVTMSAPTTRTIVV